MCWFDLGTCELVVCLQSNIARKRCIAIVHVKLHCVPLSAAMVFSHFHNNFDSRSQHNGVALQHIGWRPEAAKREAKISPPGHLPTNTRLSNSDRSTHVGARYPALWLLVNKVRVIGTGKR
jgi:hypothetical protein